MRTGANGPLREIVKSADVIEGATDPAHRTRRWSVFLDLLKETAAKQPGNGRCIINPGRDGYFRGRGSFVSVWFNPMFSDKWIPNQSICYGDAFKAGAAGISKGKCTLVNVDFRSVQQIIEDSGGEIRVEPVPLQGSGSRRSSGSGSGSSSGSGSGSSSPH